MSTENPNVKKYYVYEWYIEDTGEVFYVGKGCKYRYKTRKRENSFFMKMIESHNCNVRKVITDLTEEQAFEEEIKLISYYRENTNFRLTNILDGGNQPPIYSGEDSFSKLPHVKKKISEGLKHKWQDSNYRNEMSLKFKEFYNTEKGKKLAKEKTSKNWENEDFRNKVIDSMIKTTNSQEYREKKSKIMQQAYSSEEVREKVRGSNNGASRKIKQFDLEDNFIAEYSTLMEADELTGISYKNISKVLRGHRKTAGGYKWLFSDNKEITYKERKPYSDNLKRNRKAILQYDLNGNFIREYESVAEATKINEFTSHTNIIVNLKGRTKSAYNYIWKYKE